MDTIWRLAHVWHFGQSLSVMIYTFDPYLKWRLISWHFSQSFQHRAKLTNSLLRVIRTWEILRNVCAAWSQSFTLCIVSVSCIDNSPVVRYVALYQKCEIIYVTMVQSSHRCAVVNYVYYLVSTLFWCIKVIITLFLYCFYMFLMCLAAISHSSTRMKARYLGYKPHL